MIASTGKSAIRLTSCLWLPPLAVLTHYCVHKTCLCKQKDFIKGRHLFEAVIALWEGMEMAKETGQDITFMKIDFEKAYDRVEWQFILESVEGAGFGPGFIGM